MSGGKKLFVVSLPGHTVGHLTQERGGMVHWNPDDLWERRGQQPRLGLDFLRKPGPRSEAAELPCWFENLLPERGSELRARLCSAHGLRDGQSFRLLGALGGDLLGAVEAISGAAESDAPPPSSSPGMETRLHDAGLTGVQLKFTMSMANERLVLTAQSKDRHWIVKLPGREFEELAEVESATMSWARAAGFPVPEHFTVPYDRLDGIPAGWAATQKPAFVIRRFDRRDDGTKVHQEDLCQALEVRPRNKYGDQGPHITFEGALRLVRDACGDEDGREMARRIGFMIASGNTDAHLKNWSLVWGESTRPRLSPCYDLVSTISWDTLGWERPHGPSLALQLGGARSFAAVTDAALDRFAEGVGSAWARQEILVGVQQALDAWPVIASSAPRRMVDALARHWASVPLLGPFQPG